MDDHLCSTCGRPVDAAELYSDLDDLGFAWDFHQSCFDAMEEHKCASDAARGKK